MKLKRYAAAIAELPASWQNNDKMQLLSGVYNFFLFSAIMPGSLTFYVTLSTAGIAIQLFSFLSNDANSLFFWNTAHSRDMPVVDNNFFIILLCKLFFNLYI